MKNERNTNGNSTLAIGGVSSPLDNFVVPESSVIRINICGENHHYRLAAKRDLPFQDVTE
jgi:hypothetical protein